MKTVRFFSFIIQLYTFKEHVVTTTDQFVLRKRQLASANRNEDYDLFIQNEIEYNLAKTVILK